MLRLPHVLLVPLVEVHKLDAHLLFLFASSAVGPEFGHIPVSRGSPATPSPRFSSNQPRPSSFLSYFLLPEEPRRFPASELRNRGGAGKSPSPPRFRLCVPEQRCTRGPDPLVEQIDVFPPSPASPRAPSRLQQREWGRRGVRGSSGLSFPPLRTETRHNRLLAPLVGPASDRSAWS